MPKPIILGQAPVSPDLTPFTGRSGRTLCEWAGVETREQLMEYFDLDNLLDRTMKKSKTGQAPSFPTSRAPLLRTKFIDRHRTALVEELGEDGAREYEINQRRTVLVMGSLTWKAFDLKKTVSLFGTAPYKMVFMMVRFPHPSGLNRQLNDPEILAETIRNLRLIGGLPMGDRSPRA